MTKKVNRKILRWERVSKAAFGMMGDLLFEALEHELDIHVAKLPPLLILR